MKPEDEQKLQALEQQLVQMFRNYKPGPFAPGIHDIGRESPTKAYLPARNGRPPEEVPPGFLTALGGGTSPGAADRCDHHRTPQGAGQLDRQPRTIRSPRG